MTTRQRLVVVLAAALVVATGSTAYALAERRADRAVPVAEAPAPRPSEPTTHPTLSGPRLVFRHTGLDDEYGVVAEVPLANPGGPRTFTGVSCDRVYAVATAASCLRTDRGVTTTFEQVDLDPGWNVTGRNDLAGVPSRTRLSADGRLAASTSFVTGHTYMTTGYSTATEIHRVASTGGVKSFGNLEEFTLLVDGRPVAPADRNIWGVTFAADDNTFYVTVSTHGTTYLARGDLTTRTLTTIAAGVECPSLSPDGTRLAFKEKVDHRDGTWWTPAVLDLASMTRTVLTGERRNVDDQIAWLDDDTLLYGLARPDQAGVTDLWSLDVATRAKPRLYVEQAWSPAVIR
jgi:hypothetical protein